MDRRSSAEQATSRQHREEGYRRAHGEYHQSDLQQGRTGDLFSPLRLRFAKISPSGALLASILLLMVSGYFIAMRHSARVGILDAVFVLSLLTFLLLAISQLAQSAKASISLWQPPFVQSRPPKHDGSLQHQRGRRGRRGPEDEVPGP